MAVTGHVLASSKTCCMCCTTNSCHIPTKADLQSSVGQRDIQNLHHQGRLDHKSGQRRRTMSHSGCLHLQHMFVLGLCITLDMHPASQHLRNASIGYLKQVLEATSLLLYCIKCATAYPQAC